MTTRLLLTLALCGVLAACADIGKDDIAFDGQFFRSTAKHVDRADRQAFTVNVRPASASLAGALEAGRHEGKKYCIETFGNSVIDWTRGPDDDPSSHVFEGDTLVLQGTCEG